jgi:hypothetical protein
MEFCLNNKNIREFLKPKNIKKFELNEADSNFWNFFIAWKGVAEYEKLRLFKQTKLQEKQLKMDFQEKIAQSKLKRKANVIENLSETITSLDTIVALATIEKINILFINNHSYYLCENVEGPFAIFGDIDTIEKKDMKLEDKIERPTVNFSLKSISNYKLKELQDLHKITDMPLKKTKQELYDDITEYMK